MPALAGYMGGYNVRPANYFQSVTMQNNYGPLASLFNIPPFNQRVAFPVDGISGLADVEIDVGTTYSVNPTDSNMTIVSQSSGALRINIPDDIAPARFLGWSGSVPTKFKVTRVGITGDTAPEWLGGLEGAEVLRDLDMSMQNFIPIEGAAPARNTPATGFYQNDIGVGPDLPYQDISNGMRDYANANPNFKAYWSVLGVDVTDAYVTAKATYERDTIPQRIKIKLEFGNEDWNYAFSGAIRLKADAYRNGHYGASTFNAPLAPLVVRFQDGAPAGTTLVNAMSAGEYLMHNCYGIGLTMYLCKQNAPAGTVIVTTVDYNAENAFFKRDTTKDFDGMDAAGRKWHSVRFNQIIEIYRSVFGETRFQSQIQPVIMGRNGNNLYDQLEIDRTYVPGYFAKIKDVGMSFYFYHQFDLDTSTVTASQLEASFRSYMPTGKAYVQSAVADAALMGKGSAFYEGGPHTYGDYQGANGTNAYSIAWNGMYNGELGRAFMRDIAYFMKTTVPGAVVKYDLAGSGLWSLKVGWKDTTNKRRIGWLEGLALAGDIPVDPDPPIDPPIEPSTEGSGMTIIGLYGGPIKRDIIKSAYGATGQSDVEYELTPEEYDQGLRLLNMILARWVGQWGVSLGYNFPPPGTLGSADEESGIPWDVEDVVVQSLARQLAPNIGKTLSPEANRNYAEAIMALRSAYATLPQMQMRPDTPRGAGSRRGCLFGPFFRARRSVDEIIQ